MSKYPAKYQDPKEKEFEEKIVQIKRLSKKTKGGNKVGFSVLVVVGDKNGKVGVALGKAPDVLSAIKKGVRAGKKRLIKIPMRERTIPYPIMVKLGAAKVLLKPAPIETVVFPCALMTASDPLLMMAPVVSI